MAVDWLRSCHSGEWRFYADHPEIITKGRYFFVPEKTPHLPFAHDFGSSVWRNGDLEPPERMGEIIESPQPWDGGRLHGPMPPGIPVGTREQFEGTIQPDAVAQEVVGGVLMRCWTDHGIPLVPIDAMFQLDNCCLQLAFARLIELNGAGQRFKVAKFFHEWLGPQCTTHYFPLNGLWPAHTIVVHPSVTVVVLYGTTNATHLAYQAVYTQGPPLNFGTLDTCAVWWGFSEVVINEMIMVGCNHAAPIVLAGHSYGGATAAIIACRLRDAQANRRIGVLTFGMPKVGSKRYVEILEKVSQVHLVNDDDVVVSLPPEPDILVILSGGLLLPLKLWWGSYEPPKSVFTISPDGTKVQGPPRKVDAAVFLPIITRAIANLAPNPVTGHFMASYRERLLLGCVEHVCFPLTQAAWDIIADPDAGDVEQFPPQPPWIAAGVSTDSCATATLFELPAQSGEAYAGPGAFQKWWRAWLTPGVYEFWGQVNTPLGTLKLTSGGCVFQFPILVIDGEGMETFEINTETMVHVVATSGGLVDVFHIEWTLRRLP